MQNKYAGDIGDYGKLGLLRKLHATGLSIGVNWYLTPDERKGDGRFTAYQKYRGCDELLFNELKKIVDGQRREMAALENDAILPAVFFSQSLDYGGRAKAERTDFRVQWHKEALRQLSGADIAFVDPDNGLMTPSAEGTRRDNKYVTVRELADYYRQGTTVMYYQHKARRRDDFYRKQHEELVSGGLFPGATGLGLKFSPISQRYYFFLVRPEHCTAIRAAVEELLGSAWGQNVFSELRGD